MLSMQMLVFSKETEAKAKEIEGDQSDSEEDREVFEREAVKTGRDNKELQVVRTLGMAKVLQLHEAL